MARTQNYGLYVNEDCSVPFDQWWREISSSDHSNMTILDDILANKMDSSVYDPQNKATDIFAYIDNKIGSGSGSGGGSALSGEHNDLNGRDDPDCHPIDSITDLRDELNKRLVISDPDNLLGSQPYIMTITQEMLNGGSSSGSGSSGGSTCNCIQVTKTSQLTNDSGFITQQDLNNLNVNCTHPLTDQLDFSSWDSGAFSELLDTGATENYTVQFDASNRPVKITQQSNNHEMTIVW